LERVCRAAKIIVNAGKECALSKWVEVKGFIVTDIFDTERSFPILLKSPISFHIKLDHLTDAKERIVVYIDI